MKKILILFSIIVLILSCNTEPSSLSNGMIIDGTVSYFDYENDNLYIKIYKISRDDYYLSRIDYFDTLTVFDSIKVNEDKSFQKYLYKDFYDDCVLLVIYNNEICSNIHKIIVSDKPHVTCNFSLKEYAYLKLNIQRNIPSTNAVYFNIYSNSIFHYKDSFWGENIDTSLVYKVTKGDCIVSYDIYINSEGESEQHKYSKTFEGNNADTIYYSVELTF